MGTALFSSRWVARWEGSSSSRYIPCFEAGGHWPLCPVQQGSREGARFLSFQKIGSRPGKVNLLLTEAKGLFICLVFPPRGPKSPTNVFLTVFLPHVFQASWFLYCLAAGGRASSSLSRFLGLFPDGRCLHVCWFYPESCRSHSVGCFYQAQTFPSFSAAGLQ